MKLLYIWKESYLNFKDLELNFGSKYKFKYDKRSNKISYEFNENHIEGFFNNEENSGNIYDVTAIIGDNGVGKTSVLRLIMELAEDDSEDGNCIVILQDNDEEIHIISKSDLKEPKINDYKVNIEKGFGRLRELYVVFHSNSFEQNIYKYIGCENVYDISTTGLIIDDNDKASDYEKNKKNIDTNKLFFYKDFLRQINFVLQNNHKHLNYIPFDLPSKIQIEFNKFDDIYKYYYNNILEKIKDKDIEIEALADTVAETKSNIFKDDYNNVEDGRVISHIWNINKVINSVIGKSKNSIEDENLFKVLIFSTILFNIEKEFVFDKFNLMKYKTGEEYDEIAKELIKLSKILSYKFDNIQLDTRILSNILRNKITHMIKKYNFIDESGKILELFYILKDKRNFNSINFMNGKVELLVNNKSFALINNTLFHASKCFNVNYSWPLSSGENNLLSTYARFYGNYNESKVSNKDITILLDEPDMTLHPEWQRKYIYNITRFLSSLYENNNIHIIFTTHSPILLSDIPHSNIIYLKKEDRKEREENKTFGSNIYNLFNDNFLFKSEDKFGIIGEFASNKLDKTIEIQKDKYIRLKRIYKVKKSIENKLKAISDKVNNKNVTSSKKDKEKLDKIKGKMNERFVKTKKEVEDIRKIINLVGEDAISIVLKDKQKRIDKLCELISEKKEDNTSKELVEIKKKFDNLDAEDVNKFIHYIIKNSAGK